MALAPGSRFGAYEIVSLLGQGGMGEVYLARDTKLGRDVALKILPDAFTNDPERLARFRREAQVLASLNHPHIGAIYGLDEAGARQFLVLELVGGESLDRRIARGKIPVDEALGIAKQIAEALEAAHEKGIIHRDLKPANIAVTSDGSVKVLDFGLAKAIEPASGAAIDMANSPTITSPAMMTGVGMILGTAAYMSPEQAKGKPADKRSDVWAFGCVLCEMLTGVRAFDAKDVSTALAAVIMTEPDWAILPPDTPAATRRLLLRCLEKDSKRRLRDIGEARIALEDALGGGETIVEPSGPAGAPPLRKRRGSVIAAALSGVVIGATVVGIAVWSSTRRRAPRIERFELVSLQNEPLTTDPVSWHVALSPDGSQLVYHVRRGKQTQLALRKIDQIEHKLIPGTEEAVGPTFSPDGKQLAFASGGKIKKVALEGGPVTTLCDTARGAGLSWSWGDVLLFAEIGEPGGVFRVSAAGGKPERIAFRKCFLTAGMCSSPSCRLMGHSSTHELSFVTS
jgi:eukaryotic-like serine/threonine-protein kinase